MFNSYYKAEAAGQGTDLCKLGILGKRCDFQTLVCSREVAKGSTHTICDTRVPALGSKHNDESNNFPLHWLDTDLVHGRRR